MTITKEQLNEFCDAVERLRDYHLGYGGLCADAQKLVSDMLPAVRAMSIGDEQRRRDFYAGYAFARHMECGSGPIEWSKEIADAKKHPPRVFDWDDDRDAFDAYLKAEEQS